MIASSATYTGMVAGHTVVVSVDATTGNYKVTVGDKSTTIPRAIYNEDALRRVAEQLAQAQS